MISTLESKGQKLLTHEDGTRLAKQIGAVNYVECSAKTMENVNDVFDKAVRAVLNPPKKKKKKVNCIIL